MIDNDFPDHPHANVDIKWNDEYRLWWPSNENENVYKIMLMRVTDIDVLVKHTKTHGVCVQAGGFIGMWPARLAKFFERVYTFEPIPHLYECVKRNTNHLPSVRVYNNALGATMGEVDINPKRGGCTRVVPGGRDKAKQLTIDSLSLIRCDAIYLDVEHYELEVLEGARQTIQNFHPTVMLEMKSDTDVAYREYMDKLGYSVTVKVHGDMIFTYGK